MRKVYWADIVAEALLFASLSGEFSRRLELTPTPLTPFTRD
jgi:hypothetical protein